MTLDAHLLAEKALWVRRTVLDMAVRAKSGHVSTAYSQCELLVALYYGGLLRVRPSEPRWPDRDRFILSKGQGGLGLYPILADLGFFPKEELDRYGTPDSKLGVHSEWSTPGIELVTGSLGHGLPLATGFALALRQRKSLARVVVMVGDAELAEGSNWEAMLTASSLGLSNLILVVDRNGHGTIGMTDPPAGMIASDGPALEPLSAKLSAFGFWTVTCGGHDFDSIERTWNRVVQATPFQPRAIVAVTTKGKGASCMENERLWHYRTPAGADLAQTRKDLARTRKDERK